MKLLERLKASQQASSRIAMRGGSYSLIITAIVLAIVIVVNIFMSSLPSAKTKFDISASKLYSITSNTKAVVNNLTQDVTIYWIVQADKEDDVIENLLSKYESLSDHIRVVKRNPDVYPTFAEQYTDEKVKNNSLVVESGGRSRYISYDDIYVTETNIYSYTYNTSFDGEGAITSAIDYVTREELPQLYVLEGHGEPGLPSTFKDQIEKDNIEVKTLSLLKVDAIPEDAAAVMIYAPSSDISDKEKDMLAEYVEKGGKLFVAAGPTKDGVLENLYGLLADYSVKVNEGVVVEQDREYYAFQVPLLLAPKMNYHEITKSLIEEKYFPLMPASHGLTIGQTPSNATVTALLTTSDAAFSKAGETISYQKEEGDIDGPFAVAVAIERALGGKIVWFASSSFLDDMYNAYSSGANVDLAMNALSALIGETEAMAIRSKSLNYNYLTISDSTASLLKVLMIGVFPLVYLGAGIVVVISRRRMHRETV
ncbi:MAG: GldG family protein [Clostridiales bacterium]|nr:GldG family protein [Clostridiales bacterium]